MENIKEILAQAQPLIISLAIKRRMQLAKLGIIRSKNQTEFIPYPEYELNYTIELYKIQLISDLIKAFGNYIVKSDKISDVSFYEGRDTIEITCNVERISEGTKLPQVYRFVTDMIVAGGYNIQCAHYRYLVKTELKKINGTYYKSYKKEKEILLEIEQQEQRLKRAEQTLIEHTAKSPELHFMEFHKKDSVPSYMEADRVQQIKEMRIRFAKSEIKTVKNNIETFKKKLIKLAAEAK